MQLDKEIENNELLLSQLKRDREVFSREHIPNLLADAGIQELKLDTGEKISVEKKYYANISADRAEAAFKWLRDNGNGSLIKTSIVGQFGSGQEEVVDLLVLKNFLTESEIPFDEKLGVHPQTLKSFVRTQIENATPNFPTETFGVFIADETVVKSPKSNKP